MKTPPLADDKAVKAILDAEKTIQDAKSAKLKAARLAAQKADQVEKKPLVHVGSKPPGKGYYGVKVTPIEGGGFIMEPITHRSGKKALTPAQKATLLREPTADEIQRAKERARNRLKAKS
jgi:hypothetical protein